MKKLFISLISALLCITPAYSQMARLYSTDNILSDTQINYIFQDSDDYIWFLSQSGITRFDGNDHNYYESESATSMLEDSRGTKWIGTAAGLFRYDEKDNIWQQFTLYDGGEAATTLVTSLLETRNIDGKRYILVGTSSKGVFLIDEESYLPNEELRHTINGYLPSLYVNFMHLDNYGYMWLGSEVGGLAILSPEIKPVDVESRMSREISKFSKKIIVSAFAENPENNDILIGSFNYGLLIYDRDKDVIRRPDDKKAWEIDARSLLFTSLAASGGKTQLLVGTGNSGLMIFDPVSETIFASDFPSVQFNTDNWEILSLIEDNQNNIWVGAYLHGALVIPKSMYGFNSFKYSKNGIKWENSACVRAVYEDKEQNCLWIGTDGAGLFRISSDNKIQNFNKENSAILNNSIMALEKDSSGTLWIGYYMGGISTYRPDQGIRDFAGNSELPTLRIKVFCYDEATDNLYTGTSGGGLIIISAKERKIRCRLEDDNKWISSLALCQDGNLCVGTYDGPLLYDPRSGAINKIPVSLGNNTKRIYGITEGEYGTLWFGTGNGVLGYNRKSGLTVHIGTEEGLSSDSVRSLLYADGKVWISTSNGLNKYNWKNKEITRYYAYDGLQGNEFSTCAGFKSDDGKLYFGGNDGLTSFYSGDTEKRTYEIGSVHFTKISTLDETKDIIADKIYLPNNTPLISLAFSALEYTNPQKVSYSFILEGFDKQWRKAEFNSRVATYTNLPYGNYTMKVRAYFDGSENLFAEDSIKIHIEAPWYLKWWAFFIYTALAAAIIIVCLKLYRHKQNAAETKKKDEMKEIRLGMFTNMTHEIRTPLSLVMNPLKKMRENEQDPRQKEEYNLMYRNCLRINRIVNQLMDLRKVDSGQMKLHFVKTDIISFIKDIMQSFEGLATSGNISFDLLSDTESQFLWIDQGNFDKIVFNILSNAFKHTEAGGRIEINVREPQNSRSEISIYNSGEHIDDKYLEKIFDRFFQADDVKDSKIGSGVGLNLTKSLVELHHGSIKAENAENGVLFTITLPEGCAHLTKEELATTDHHKDLYTQGAVNEIVLPVPDAIKEGKTLRTRKNIVIVEDDLEALEYYRKELSFHYNVRAFQSPAKAVKAISETLPDLVVTDLLMPEMDGCELCGKIRHNPITNLIPVIILTSEQDEEVQKKCSEAGADRFFTKPVSIDVIVSGISQILNSRNLIKGKYSNTAEYGYDKVEMPFDRSRLYEKIVEIIKTNLDNPDLNVEKLSQEAGMSRVHLNRKLKELGCVSPGMLIKTIRLKQAAYLLLNNKVNISEVCYRVGFSSHAYFTHAFHDYFGLTPKEFISKYQEDKDGETVKKLLE